MQFYDLRTIERPAPAQAEALARIANGSTEALSKMDEGAAAKVGFRVAAVGTTDSHRMIVDVALGGEILPIDLGTWAFFPENGERAVGLVVARAREILARREEILSHLAGLRARVESVLAEKGGLVRMVGLHFWPIEGSVRFTPDELRHELRVEQFGFAPGTTELRRLQESYHGYGIRELTGCIRRDAPLQHRMAELRGLLDQAGVGATLDQQSQVQLVDGRVQPTRIAERLVANARAAAARG